jgi:hypothetical protein
VPPMRRSAILLTRHRPLSVLLSPVRRPVVGVCGRDGVVHEQGLASEGVVGFLRNFHRHRGVRRSRPSGVLSCRVASQLTPSPYTTHNKGAEGEHEGGSHE